MAAFISGALTSSHRLEEGRSKIYNNNNDDDDEYRGMFIRIFLILMSKNDLTLNFFSKNN
jgi:hypothetical protein